MLESPRTDDDDDQTGADRPPGADPRRVAQGHRIVDRFAGADVPAEQGQIKQEQDRAPGEIAEGRRLLITPGALIQPRDQSPDAEHDRDEEETDLWTFH